MGRVSGTDWDAKPGARAGTDGGLLNLLDRADADLGLRHSGSETAFSKCRVHCFQDGGCRRGLWCVRAYGVSRPRVPGRPGRPDSFGPVRGFSRRQVLVAECRNRKPGGICSTCRRLQLGGIAKKGEGSRPSPSVFSGGNPIRRRRGVRAAAFRCLVPVRLSVFFRPVRRAMLPCCSRGLRCRWLPANRWFRRPDCRCLSCCGCRGTV